MGTINYKTSKYITLGIEPYSYDDFMDESGEIDYNQISDNYEADRENIEFLIERHEFSFFSVKICAGYYEGFSLDIDPEYYECFDDWQEKQAALKEATQLKRLLLDCIDCGLCEVWPGWCTSYKGRDESIKAVKAAIREIKDEIKKTPTWRKYRGFAYEC